MASSSSARDPRASRSFLSQAVTAIPAPRSRRIRGVLLTPTPMTATVFPASVPKYSSKVICPLPHLTQF